ncbi:hypothetical protein FA13DRAFT_1803088 [Coprinellus micaceus]|uniref:Uncharacterized protein n=1 Tax=Coprinellus micaceus TaxID=71717 RepID=A0A4Y7SAU8_COPMI|nr:hypothetical protein FA13DRAFT_1803088 [Coprinellus micaceus]
MAVISPDLIADTEAYASTITRLSAEPYIDYGSRKIKLLHEHFPFDCEAYESVPLMSVDPSGAIAAVHLPGILSSRLRQQVQQALQVLQDAGITDKHPCGWAYGWGTPIVELNDGGLCGGPPGWAATIGAIADAYNHCVWHQKLVTDVLTALASNDPSDPEAYSAMKPYKVLDVLFEVNTFAWWGDTANITVHGFSFP